jgi:hypothetical protein
MAKFIKSLGGNSTPVNINKVKSVEKGSINISKTPVIHFKIGKKSWITWSYETEIQRDSDYEMIVNNQMGRIPKFMFPCVEEMILCDEHHKVYINEVIKVKKVISISKGQNTHNCYQHGDTDYFSLKIVLEEKGFQSWKYPTDIQRDSDYELLKSYMEKL